ncbi:hypothetical protein sync_1541 [Synechococcus sp. CC9311]|nr:hypothetical protein sync_1541 [Synechococcus sp. CC9311]
MNLTKFILRASLLVLAVLVAVAFVLVRRDSIVGGDSFVGDQTKSQRFLVRNGRDRTQSPSTSNSY